MLDKLREKCILVFGMRGDDTIWRKQSGVEWSVIKCIRGQYRTFEKDNVDAIVQELTKYLQSELVNPFTYNYFQN